MTLLRQYQPNSIKIKVEKIACYTRFTRQVIELIRLEHDEHTEECSKPSRSTIDCLVQLV
jgi:hypothetical protein